MAVVKPFLCVRPKQEFVSRVAALPYDVYNRQEACDEVKKEPLSFLKIDRAETQFDDSVDTYDARVYLKAKELLEGMIADGTFVLDEERAYFIYELTMNSRIQTGIVACSSIDDYNNNVIKKHENTRADKEIDRITHVDTCNAQTGPIFLAYRDNIVIDQEVEKARKNDPIYNFTSDDNIKHTVWKISAIDSIDKIQKAFATINEIYIADGHHRAASAVKVGMHRREANPAFTGQEEYNFFLSVLFPDEQLMIMPYNRVVKDLNGDSKEVFFEKVSKYFTIEKKTEKVSPSRKATFGMYFDHEWYLLTASKEIISDDPVKGLDVAILQDNLLAPILGINDPKTDKRIDFVGGIRGLEELERRTGNDMKIAFSMYPTSIGELFAVADADKLMPPKSTWFEPKLRSGIFIHRI
ncbi:DUF1015 domain-containing protein [[Clostridium] fimetarium]|uniref:Uncharacterized conserved protein, DUF1015 family n=1 Tax=[Clostridium] fimetarium TaxID=99656 RepID=A0A1I0QZQ5_9FIRM|nr:DUF1015 domain-containing protein [[Clostridium] fimetarium]SEW32937.1 Uncharacterized conserved protein, DUF1015 family [[Clostridium] fimetarium]